MTNSIESNSNVNVQNMLEHTSIKVAFSTTCNFICEYCGGGKNRAHSGYPAAMEDYRATPINHGKILSTSELLSALQSLREAGFGQIRPTGGEPTLNPDWANLVEGAANMGYSVDITTNASLLNRYLDIHGKLPDGLSMVKVSLDTDDPEEFRKISGGKGDLKDIEKAIQRIIELGVYVRANTVLIRENCNPNKLKRIIEYAKSLGIPQVQFLDLVYYPNYPSQNTEVLEGNKSYWEKQFVAFEEFQDVLVSIYPEAKFELASGQFGVNFWKATLDNGVVITFKDSTTTMRDEKCFACTEFCQEGRCLLRLGTDGNVTPCPDYRAELPDHFNVLESVSNGSFEENIGVIIRAFWAAERTRTIELFAKKHGLVLPERV